MRELYAKRKSGTLEVSRASIKKRLYFKNGVAVFADSGNGQAQTREQAELLAYSLFTWTSGEFAFEEGQPQIDDSVIFEGSPSTVILEGSRRIDEPEILERLIGGSETIFGCTQTSVLPLFKMILSPAENAILTFARARERFTIEELPLPSQDLPVLSALNALVAVGLLEILNRPTPPEPEAMPAPATAPPPAPVSAAPLPPIQVAAPPPQPQAPLPPAAVPTAPARPMPEPPPQSASIMPEVPSEMEHVLNTFEAKRAGGRPRPAPPVPAPVQPPPPAQPPAPIIEAAPAPEPPQPQPTYAPPVVVTVPAPVYQPEQPVAPPQPVQPVQPAQPPVEVAPTMPPPPPPEPSGPPITERLGTLMRALAELLPKGKARLVVGGSIVAVGLAIALVLWLTSGNDEASPPDDVVAADSADPDQAPTPAPLPPPPEPEPLEVPEPEPSEAELFYRANVAFESGEFEQAKTELMILLEFKPNLVAAKDLLAKVEKELEPEPPPPPPKPKPRRTVRRPAPKPEPEPEPVAPPPPTPAELFASARNALVSGELERAQAKLDELEAVDSTYPGASQLRDQIAEGFWKQTLPLAYSARHDHALGGCNGVLTLTARGIGYGSKDHEWFWSFGEISTIARRDARRMRIETSSDESYNFDLRDSLANDDWARYQQLRSR